jgi:alkanesulfonate monooxygenase SsuD/methylene tetrahydromethanopterin reductase-like flavin-dependent oxidoreductase (luciferase family)
VDGWFLGGEDIDAWWLRAREAEAQEAAAVIVRRGPLGDPLVLAGALSSVLTGPLLGVAVALDAESRHPAVLARDVTALDLLCAGRALVCFEPPFGEGLVEALALCRAMWRDGVATSDGPIYPVRDAVNLPRPATAAGPVVALDLSGGEAAREGGPGAAAQSALPELLGLVDLVLRPGGQADRCRLERV